MSHSEIKTSEFSQPTIGGKAQATDTAEIYKPEPCGSI